MRIALRLHKIGLFTLLLLFGRATGGLLYGQEPWPNRETVVGLEEVCVTTRLLASPEGRAAALAYDAASKASGSGFPAAPRTAAVGDTAIFNVRTKILLDPAEHVWEEVSFVLRAEQVVFTVVDKGVSRPLGFRIWVDLRDWNQSRVTDSHIEGLHYALGEGTPPESIDPRRGILENNTTIFGLPPWYPLGGADAYIDILLTDVVEGAGGGVINGFFDPNDLNGNLAGTKRSNQAEIVYLDTRPTLTAIGMERVIQTLAHELQHLIHFRWDPRETTFVNEGQSEWAQLLNGYEIRDANYLAGGSTGSNVALFASNDDWSKDVLVGYQRAGLWTNYLADQFGPEFAGAITRDTGVGAEGYRGVLRAFGDTKALEEVILDFHTANLINDYRVDRRFAYYAPRRGPIPVEPGYVFSGAEGTSTPITPITLRPGGAEYLVWRSVRDFTLRIDVLSAQRSRIGARVVATRPGGATYWEDLSLLDAERTFTGEFERIALVLAQTNVSSPTTDVRVSADWVPANVRIAEVRYDAGTWALFFLPGDGQQSGYITRFQIPEDEGEVALHRVLLPNYYISQFRDGPPETSPRDFTLVVLGSTPTGNPGDEILALQIDDPRPFEQVLSGDPLKYAEVDLSSYRDLLVDLQGPLYIGAVNRHGSVSNLNHLVVALSFSDSADLSFSRGYEPQWIRLWDQKLRDGTPLQSHFAPVRAEFQIGGQTVAVSPEEVPNRPTALLGNYPNPFSRTTLLQYHLSTAGPVDLSVYDVTGRRLERLVGDSQERGSHAVWLDGTGWASGIYVAVLETEEGRFTHLLSVAR
jgi:hypothetical protein